MKLDPDPLLNRMVILAGAIAMMCGVFIIAELRLHPAWRFAGGIVWTVDCLYELKRMMTGIRWLRQITLDSAGGIRALDAVGNDVVLTLRSGSVVLPELAWLRVADNAGRKFTGLFARRRSHARDWHRLQLLWRQSGKTFGHPAGP
ncbi:MAG: hypothetical protein ACR2Q3_03205 [Woeseiaceae bacterium]